MFGKYAHRVYLVLSLYLPFAHSFCLLQFRYMYGWFSITLFAGSGWSVPVELIVGADVGISYSTEKSQSPTLLADFNQVSFLYDSLYFMFGFFFIAYGCDFFENWLFTFLCANYKVFVSSYVLSLISRVLSI